MKSLRVAAYTVGVGVPAGVAIAADLPLPMATPGAVEVHGHGGGDVNSPVTLFPVPMSASSMF